jgi:cytochrome c556
MACLLSLLLWFCPSMLLAAGEQAPDAEGNYWMQKKLELSQAILAGLATGDFEQIRDKAVTMQKLSTVEGWARRSSAKEYRRQLKIFQQATEAVIQRAEQGDLDGATLGFTHLTVSCVNCHKHLRDTTGE